MKIKDLINFLEEIKSRNGEMIEVKMADGAKIVKPIYIKESNVVVITDES